MIHFYKKNITFYKEKETISIRKGNHKHMEKKKLGILGGMGSEATVLFYKKIIDNTSVNNDREHLDILVYNHASIPDRTECILCGKQDCICAVLACRQRTLSGKITPNTEFGRVDDVRVWVPQLKRENIAGNMPIVEMLKSFAAEKQATPAQVSLAWMLRKYTNVVPIPGSKNKERIMENLRACEVQLTDEEFDRLESELDRLPIYGIRGHAETEQTSFGNNWLKQK